MAAQLFIILTLMLTMAVLHGVIWRGARHRGLQHSKAARLGLAFGLAGNLIGGVIGLSCLLLGQAG